MLLKKMDVGMVASYFIIIVFSLFCLFPFLLVLMGSITAESDIMKYGYRLIPKNFSILAYRILFVDFSRIANAYRVTIFVTITGTFFNLMINSMAGYVLSRKFLRYRKICSIYTIITLLFSGGMVPWYIICVNVLNLKDKTIALIIPYLASAWFILLLRNFFQSIPDELYESAKIDGAGEFKIFYRIMLPVAKPALATVGLFAALNYWNDWWLGLMLIDDNTKRPLQLILRTIVSNVMFLQSSSQATLMEQVGQNMPSESVKMAVTIVTIGPVIFFYPYVQRYFIKGIMVGSIKG